MKLRKSQADLFARLMVGIVFAVLLFAIKYFFGIENMIVVGIVLIVIR